MQAAERFFEGEFADIEGDVSMEPATPVALITPSRMPQTAVCNSQSLSMRTELNTFE